MEEGDDMTPFWLQTSDNRRRRSSSFFSTTGILIILLLLVALAFVFFIVPSFLSLTSKLKPQLVKKSWDSLNLVLVLFAIICGFLSNAGSKSNNDNNTPKHVPAESNSNPSTSAPAQWYEYEYDQYSSSSDRSRTALQRLKSSSSYPDLRRDSSWMMNGDDRWRFYDDTHLYKYYPSGRSRRKNDEERVYAKDTKDIAVDTGRTSPPPPQSSPPQLPRVVRRKPKRTNYEDVKAKVRGEQKEVILNEMKIKHSLPPARSPPSKPPPPPPPPPTGRQEKRSSKDEKKTGGGTKEFLVSLRRKKKKKERQRSVENLEEFFRISTLPSPPPPPPPPPAPLPPFYQSIFHSKKSKGRKHHSIPPSPPSSLAVKPQKPPLSVKINDTNNVEESMESGNESPINPIPPPPPPPPFKLRPWKFEVQGDFVRLKSINISRSDSPDSDDTLSGEASPSDGNKKGEMAGAMFCASPDVDTKADNFIARFRAGLTLEKINSVRGRSNLGPDPGPTIL
ncbi:hypothetical protein HRI_002274700 [Hibiscus trionum]|uniref:Hydroxyproline-rich glycoprotein family protein n=1 Tax=Hibiscus trionum TaxID=183268 RepID=A0A9W7HX42_HIBTR|nr:hypothetical protein HRI_002274700 [Hibiscus trionum]